MEQKISTRGLTESAIMAALISVIVILSSYFSFLYGIAMMILPIIVAVVHYRHDFKYSAGCVIVSMVITSIMFNPITGVTMGVSYGIVGIALGYAVRKKYKPYRILIYTILASGIAITLDFALTGILISGQNIFEFMKSQAVELSDIFAVSIDQSVKMYESIGVTGKQIEMMNQMKSVITPELILMIFPSVIVIASFLQGYVCYLLFSVILSKLRYAKLEVIKFSDFYVTNLVGAALIGIMCIALILYGRGFQWGITVYNSVYMITLVILGINGIAATQYFFTKRLMLPKAARVLIIIAVFIMGMFFIFGIIGFVEMLLDFRRLDPHRLRKV